MWFEFIAPHFEVVGASRLSPTNSGGPDTTTRSDAALIGTFAAIWTSRAPDLHHGPDRASRRLPPPPFDREAVRASDLTKLVVSHFTEAAAPAEAKLSELLFDRYTRAIPAREIRQRAARSGSNQGYPNLAKLIN